MMPDGTNGEPFGDDHTTCVSVTSPVPVGSTASSTALPKPVVMNTRSQEMTGLHEAHTIGAAAHEVVELVSGATRQPVKIPVEEALRERIPLHLHEQLWVVASDGRMAPVSCTITPVEDPGAGLQGSVVVLHPVDTH